MRKKLHISYNPAMNNQQPQNSNNQNINRNSINLNNSNSNKKPTNNQRNKSTNMKKFKEMEKAKKMKEMEIEAEKKENQLEDEIRDHLKCYICLGKVFKPKMCKYCKKICCSACIDHWLEDHSFCGICKHEVSSQDMISIPFLDDMSTFFINNIDNQQKKKIDKSKTSLLNVGQKVISGANNRNNQNKIHQINLIQQPNINININNIDNNLDNNESNINNEINNEINDTEEAEMDENICQEHEERISYYCIQCNKYYCSKCLIFFGNETQKHRNHFLVQVNKINDLGVTQAIQEYQKLKDTKEKFKDLIGLINMIKREKEIKKYEMINIIEFIREYNKIKMDEENQKYQNIINSVRNERSNLQNQRILLPKELNTILDQNNMNKTNELKNKIMGLNNSIPPNFIFKKDDPGYQTQNINIENYQSDFITKKLNIIGDLNDECEILNTPCNIIPHNSSYFGITYTGGKFGISFTVNVREDMNSPKYPVFNTYIIFKGIGYGLEFLTLKNMYLEKKRNRENINNLNGREQINLLEIDKDKFMFLCDNNYQISFKICVIKLSYK